MSFTLNEMQEVASEKFQYWYKHPECRKRPWFEISGAAGTGKTTVVKHIIASLGLNNNEVVFMAYVGKAALALRLSGVEGRTIHSVIYKTIQKYKRDEHGDVIYQKGHPILEYGFTRTDRLSPEIKLFVIDEGSMVPSDMVYDILSFRIPTLVLGDLNQLPPVFGNSTFLKDPDVTLNKIMRQKDGSAILYLAQLATHGIPISYGTYGGGECNVIKKKNMTNEMLAWADIIICSTNHERDKLNYRVRKEILGITDDCVTVGEKLVCRTNCWNRLLNDKSLGADIALVNGLIGTVTKRNKNTGSSAQKLLIDFKPEFSDVSFRNVPIDPHYVLAPTEYRETVNKRFMANVAFELGYCSTCHLAQGSQYPNVLVYLESDPGTSEYSRQWLYTAITRAQEKLIIVA
jgi:exodeoxyribonuclease-5